MTQPFPFFPPLSSHLSLPFHPLLFPVAFPSFIPLDIGPLKSSCKLRQWGLGGAPAEIEFGVFQL